MLPDLYIAIPTARSWEPEFGMSMILLSAHLTKLRKEGKIKGFRVDNKRTSLLSKNRQMLLDGAMKSDCTHILWCDDDQSFTPDCVMMMLNRDKDFVSANICKKTFVDGGFVASKGGGAKISSVGRTGIEQAELVGLGLALMKLEPLRKTKAPHFETVWVDEAQKYIGEDIYFAAKIKHDLGISPWIDHDASQMVGHVGTHVFSIDDVERFVPAMESAA